MKATPIRRPLQSPSGSGESTAKTGQAHQTQQAQQATGTNAARSATPEPMPQLRAATGLPRRRPGSAFACVGNCARRDRASRAICLSFRGRIPEHQQAKPQERATSHADEAFADEFEADIQTSAVQLQSIADDTEPSIATPDILEPPLAEQGEAKQQALPPRDTEHVQDAPFDDRSVTDDAAGHRTQQQQNEKQASAADRSFEKPVRIMAETLKALVQNTLPLPEGASAETSAYRQTASGRRWRVCAKPATGDFTWPRGHAGCSNHGRRSRLDRGTFRRDRQLGGAGRG